MDPTTALIVAVLLGPVAAIYDFCTNPNAPPQIFAVQYEQAFGHPSSLPVAPKPARVIKHVYVTHG